MQNILSQTKIGLSLHHFFRKQLPSEIEKMRKSVFRAFSSAGSEHLPYKQRVGGSNPSTPTTETECNMRSVFLLYKDRLKRHNTGRSNFMKSGVPWKIVYQKEYHTKVRHIKQKFISNHRRAEFTSRNLSQARNKNKAPIEISISACIF